MGILIILHHHLNKIYLVMMNKIFLNKISLNKISLVMMIIWQTSPWQPRTRKHQPGKWPLQWQLYVQHDLQGEEWMTMVTRQEVVKWERWWGMMETSKNNDDKDDENQVLLEVTCVYGDDNWHGSIIKKRKQVTTMTIDKWNVMIRIAIDKVIS